MSRTYEAKASEGLAQLGLSFALELLDSTAQKAAASKWSYSHSSAISSMPSCAASTNGK